MTAEGPGLQESLAIIYPMLSRAARLTRTLADLDGDPEVARQAQSVIDGLREVADQAGIPHEPRDGRALLALELHRALDVLAEANVRRLRGHGPLSDEDAAALKERMRRLDQLGAELVAAVRRLPPTFV